MLQGELGAEVLSVFGKGLSTPPTKDFRGFRIIRMRASVLVACDIHPVVANHLVKRRVCGHNRSFAVTTRVFRTGASDLSQSQHAGHTQV